MQPLLLKQPREAQLGCNTTSSVASSCWIQPAVPQSNIQTLWMTNRIEDRPKQSGNASVPLGLYYLWLELSEVWKCLMSWPRCASEDTKHRVSQGTQHPDRSQGYSQTDRHRTQPSTAEINTVPLHQHPGEWIFITSQLMLLILAWFTFVNKEETCLVQEYDNSDTALFKQLQKTCAPVATHCVYVHQNRGNHEEFLSCGNRLMWIHQ